MARWAAAAPAALLLLLLLLLASSPRPSAAFTDTGCSMRPENDQDNVIEDAKSVTLECTFDSRVESCTWTHNEPMNERRGSSSSEPDFRCTGVPDQFDKYCADDNSISVIFSETSCGINIGNTRPDHTGRWELNAWGFSATSATTAQLADHLFTLYTYNQSTVYLYDYEGDEVDNSNVDTTYNYNDRNDKWEDDVSNWENLEFVARAYGGRPEPVYQWYIDSNRGDDLKVEHPDIFRISEGIIGCEDDLGFICNSQSSISFGVDDKLMEVLDEMGVDTNPEDENVHFELNCDIIQEGMAFIQTVRVEINVEKSYDNGALPASTIGIIVAVVVAVLILLLVICLLLMAKRSKRWCFAEDEEGAAADGRRSGRSRDKKDPRDPRSQARYAPQNQQRAGVSPSPRTQKRREAYGGGGRGSSSEMGHHSQQVQQSATTANKSAAAAAITARATSTNNASNNRDTTKKPLTSSSSSSSTSSTPIKKQNWTLPPKELRESLNRLNEQGRKGDDTSSSSSDTTPQDTMRKGRPPPLDLREPLFKKNVGAPSSSHSPHSSSHSSSRNTNPTGATPKVHKGVWQASPPFPEYQTTTSTSSSSPSVPRMFAKNGEASAPPPPLPKKPGSTGHIPSSSASNRESLNYADLDLQQQQQPSRRSFMQDPRNRVLPPTSVMPLQSPSQWEPSAPPSANATTTTTTTVEATEYATLVSSSKIV